MTQAPLRALVVDDQSSWQQILGEILSDCALEVNVAGTLDEAVFQLKTLPHRLAVVDLSLSPDDHNNTDGLRVLDAVRRLDPDCRTILLTGFATVELAVAALTDYGAFTFLRKESFHRGQFQDIISRILVSAPPRSKMETSDPLTHQRQASFQASHLEAALVVEDDAGWRSVLEELLSDEGFQVKTCAGFGEATGYMRKERFTLVVIDLSLQNPNNTRAREGEELNMDGYRLLQAAQLEGFPTVVVSGVTDHVEIQRIFSTYNISAFIEKQAFDRAAFRRAVQEARTNQAAVDELTILTEREREVLNLLAEGLPNKDIASKLFITINTVKRHLKAIYEKLDVHTRSAAAARARK